MSVLELDAPPKLGPLYRGAALTAVRRKAVGGRTGDTLPDLEVRVPEVAVDRAHLAAYDRVCGFRLSDELPATYPHILAFPLAVALMARPDFPLALVGLVHVANHIEVHRPLTADDRFELRVRAQDLRPHERGRQVDLVAEALVDGGIVWTGRSVYLRRESTPGGTDKAVGGDRRERSAEPPAPPAASALWRATPRVGTDYAEVSGDHNPIHTSRLGARLLGFPTPIAHGMWSKARCLAALEGRLPRAYAVDVAFKLPVRLPSTVAFAATPTGSDGWRFGLHAAKSGKPHLTGDVVHRP
ncbi:MaoC/PaaZ C-terminal domain-containing protein [Planosporangium sp. 12N6]|uniref:MaoC/PaaZ C-terminal domain-containing protein n=1 Tax=Planosporangium spinosum TaxID=3402278 RepID=UPI003CE68D5B